MEIIAALSVGVLILAALFVVIKTFVLWFRTRALPEFLLGAYLLCATVLGYPITIAASQTSASEMWPLHLLGQVMMSLGFTFLLLFTRTVFRPDALWPKVAIALSLLLFVSASVAYFRELTGSNPRPSAELIGINLTTTAPITFAYFWTTAESLIYHRRLKLRLRLGLTEVRVVNRVWLWGAMTLSAGIAVLVSVVGLLLGDFMSTSLVLVLSCLGIVQTCCLFLAFHAPDCYGAWLTRRAAAEAG